MAALVVNTKTRRTGLSMLFFDAPLLVKMPSRLLTWYEQAVRQGQDSPCSHADPTLLSGCGLGSPDWQSPVAVLPEFGPFNGVGTCALFTRRRAAIRDAYFSAPHADRLPFSSR